MQEFVYFYTKKHRLVGEVVFPKDGGNVCPCIVFAFVQALISRRGLETAERLYIGTELNKGER